MKQQEKMEDKFDFIKEKIKDKPINKKRLLIRAGYNLLCAVIFGSTACFVFVWLRPYMEDWLYPEKGSAISIPKDDILLDGGVVKKEDFSQGGSSGQTQESQEKDDKEQSSTQQKPEENVHEPGQSVEPQLELEDFQKLQSKLYAIGKEANKSVVTVTGVTSGMDWFDTPYESESRSAGVIFGSNEQELLILTEKKTIVDAQSITITFIDGEEVSASLKKYDGNTGIAVICVPVSDISKQTMEKIEVASWGNSYTVTQGTVVIAIGSPLGTSY